MTVPRWVLGSLLGAAILVAACTPQPDSRNAASPAPTQAVKAPQSMTFTPPPSFNPESHRFSHCHSSPPPDVSLTTAELCQIELLSARCNPADDCLVACIASAENREVGGGCWHTCFAVVHELGAWQAPDDLAQCNDPEAVADG